MADYCDNRSVHPGRRALEHRRQFRNVSARVLSCAGRCRKNICCPDIQGNSARLFAGQPDPAPDRCCDRCRTRHPAGPSDRLEQMGPSYLLACPVVLPGHRRHRLVADPADLVRLRPDDDDVRHRLYCAFSDRAEYRAWRRVPCIEIWRVRPKVSAHRGCACFGK